VLYRDAERAEAAAKEEEDRRLQKVDPKNSLAWKRGGESRVSWLRGESVGCSINRRCGIKSNPLQGSNSGL
jgi:hypothetical protein